MISAKSKNLIELNRRGIIPDEAMMLRAVSGKLPAREEYEEMSETERNDFWKERIEKRFGLKWFEEMEASRRKKNLPPLLKLMSDNAAKWLKEGF